MPQRGLERIFGGWIFTPQKEVFVTRLLLGFSHEISPTNIQNRVLRASGRIKRCENINLEHSDGKRSVFATVHFVTRLLLGII